MPSPEPILARIRAEYREMPGLRLTFAQACRLWQLDAATCEGVLQSLLAQNFLVRTANGSFMALPTPQVAWVTPLKATMGPSGTAALRVRHSA